MNIYREIYIEYDVCRLSSIFHDLLSTFSICSGGCAEAQAEWNRPPRNRLRLVFLKSAWTRTSSCA